METRGARDDSGASVKRSLRRKKPEPVDDAAPLGTVLSFPKSGRSWLRLMLDRLAIPMEYTHADGAHSDAVDLADLQVDESVLVGAPVLLTRDPRDTVVS